MYCPKCGQSQVNDGVRFCSRCGFLLESVSNLLASAGQLPVMYNENNGGHMSPRKRGARKGATLVMLGIFFVPLFFFLHELIGTPHELALMGLLFILAGILRLLFALFFEESARRTPPPAPPLYVPPQHATPRLNSPAQQTLPPAQQQGAPGFNYRQPQANTSEMVQPRGSVTDHTTRLLEKESDSAER